MGVRDTAIAQNNSNSGFQLANWYFIKIKTLKLNDQKQCLKWA